MDVRQIKPGSSGRGIMPVVTITSANDRSLYKTSVPSDYPGAHDVADGDGFTGHLAVGQVQDILNQYQIWRGGVSFDLSVIPLGCTIISAQFSYMLVAIHAALGIIHLVNGDDLNMPLVVADYGYLLNQVTSFGNFDPTGLSLSTRYTFDLNASGLAKLIPGATVKFGLRHVNDIDNIPPTYIAGGAGDEGVYIYRSTVSGKEPKLLLTYQF